MFSTLRARLWLLYAGLIVAVLAVVAMVLAWSLLRSPLLYRQSLESLRLIETMVVARFQDGEALSRGSKIAALENIDRVLDVRLLLLAEDRSLLYDTRANDEAALRLPRMLNENRPPLLRDENGKTWVYSQHRLPDGSWLVSALPRARLTLLGVLANDLFTPFLQAGIIALLLSLLIALLIARWVADPLQRVIAVSRQMPVQDVLPVKLAGPREVQELTRAFNDMTSRVQASRRSQKDFVANVSHELKTPLTAIQGFAQAIVDGTANSPNEQQKAAQVIFTEAARMHRMVLDLLELARIDAGMLDIKKSPVDLLAVLGAVVEKFSLQAGQSGIDIILEPVQPVTVIADGDRLAQVFTNLVENAMKYTPTGGKIRLSLSEKGGQALVTVTDSGAGIPEEAQAHIFERFYRADAARTGGSFQGAGLGLAIAQEIIQAHNGKISVHSQTGYGTTFRVSLPTVQPDATTLISRGKK